MSGVNQPSSILSISLKTQTLLERIITTIKDMDNSLPDSDLPQLKRLLYRSMDNLKELESELLQLKVAKLLKNTQ